MQLSCITIPKRYKFDVLMDTNVQQTEIKVKYLLLFGMILNKITHR